MLQKEIISKINWGLGGEQAHWKYVQNKDKSTLKLDYYDDLLGKKFLWLYTILKISSYWQEIKLFQLEGKQHDNHTPSKTSVQKKMSKTYINNSNLSHQEDK